MERGKKILQSLAETYPSPRRKEEVPLWFHIAGNLSMRLHGVHSFHAYPMIVQAGGMLNAFGPDAGRKCQASGDRGFLDGRAISRCKSEFGIDVLIPIRRNMDIYEDAGILFQQSDVPWTRYAPRTEKPSSEKPPRPKPKARRSPPSSIPTAARPCLA